MQLTDEQKTVATMLALASQDKWPKQNAFVFVPGGLLVEWYWNPHKGFTAEIVTDAVHILGSWYDHCAIGREDETVTLKDICSSLLSLDNLKCLSQMQYLKTMPAAAMRVVDGPSGNPLPYEEDLSGLSALELYWTPIVESDGVKRDSFPDLHATAKDGVQYAIDFIDPARLGHLPVVLKTRWDLRKTGAPTSTGTQRLIKASKPFTLGEVLVGLFYELTWHGPDNGASGMKGRIGNGDT